MKFHHIKISNINSLYDEQRIDLDGDFRDIPLYLIHGPTGAGKTTILDAVCLALFGETPRQTGGRRGATSVAEMVNSQGTGTSRAEVEFSVLDVHRRRRTRYRAVWGFRRAHGSPDGNPQPLQRELHIQQEDQSWRALAASTRQADYDEHFRKIFGTMTLEDFLRSVMLAQGQFAALLHADSKDKVRILERLTDASDYEQLGALAHERWKLERDAFKALNEQVERADGVSEAELERARAALNHAREDLRELKNCLEYVQKRHDWLKKRDDLAVQSAQTQKNYQKAEQTHAAHTADFQTLALDRRARPARQPLVDLRRLEGEFEEIEQKIPRLSAQTDEKSAEFERAQAAEKTANTALEAAQAHEISLKPKIQAAKEAEQDQKHAAHALAAGKQKSKAAQTARDAAAQRLQFAKEAFSAAQSAQTSAAEKLARLSDGEQIGARIAELKAGAESFKKQLKNIAQSRKKAAQFRQELAQKTAALNELNRQIAGLEVESAPLEKSLDQAKNALEAELGDFDRPRERRDAIEADRTHALTQLANLQDLAQLVESREQKQAQAAHLKQEHAAQTTEIQRLTQCLAPLEEAKNAAQTRQEALLAEIDRLKQSLLAAELRQHLQHGDACPVCGSAEHPAAQAAPGELFAHAREQADITQKQLCEDELAKLKTALLQNEEEHIEIQAKIGAADTALSRVDALLEVAQQDVKEVEATLVCGLQKAGQSAQLLELSADDLYAELEQAKSEIKAQIAEFDARKKRLDDAQDTVEACEISIQKTRETLQKTQNQQKNDQQAVEFGQKQLEDARSSLADLVGASAADFSALIDVFASLGLSPADDAQSETIAAIKAQNFEQNSDQIFSEKNSPQIFDKCLKILDNLLDLAAHKHNAWHHAKAVAQGADERVIEVQLEVEKAQVQHENDLMQFTMAEQETSNLTARLEQADRALGACVEALDGRSAQQAEDELGTMMKSARHAREQALMARQEAEKSLQQARDALAHARADRALLGEKLESTKNQLDTVVAAIIAEGPELRDLAEVEAALLADDRREELQKLCEALELSLRDARRDSERLAGEVEGHQAALPGNFEPENYDLSTLSGCCTQLANAVDAQHQQIGSLSNAVDTLVKNLAALGELIARRDRQREKFDVWGELNSLIGTNKGQNFKEFALGLHLDRIMIRANQRLRQLHPRYELSTELDEKTGLPSLNFEIIDHFRAGSRRPISTLSGGETFLISLGLALALADQQQIDLPMETLFLDEGFGTLDRESLNKAMKTLKALHAGIGRTVAVISHVEALRDEITHQIKVEPLVEGRSRVRQVVREEIG